MRLHWKLLTVLMTISLLTLVGACAGDDDAATVELEQREEAVELSPEELGALGARLEENPDQIEEILAEQGLTLETFEAAIRDVTENPGEAKRYAEAYRNASG
ncbi:MAG: hypothetical protein KY432_05965 [Acidobacteria bacterium]|nr:hypothetical protein [Acidobacteriota bacterium]